MSNGFNSEISERTYLKEAAPVDVLRHLDSIVQSIKYNVKIWEFEPAISQRTLDALLERNNKIIDIGLAPIVQMKDLKNILDRNQYDPDVVLSATHSRMFDKERFGEFGTEFTLKVISGNNTESQANLLENRFLHKKTLESLLYRKKPFEQIDDDGFGYILADLLRNPALYVSPNDRHQYDQDQHALINGLWELSVRLPATMDFASLLSGVYKKVPEVWVPVFSSAPKTQDENRKENYIKYIFEKWFDTNSSNDPLDTKGWDYFGHLRSEIVEAFSFDITNDKEAEFIIKSGDRFGIYGLFKGLNYVNFVSLNKKMIEKYFRQYGRLFLDAVINNDNLYRKGNAENYFYIVSLINSFVETESRESFETLRAIFRFRRERLLSEDPEELYIDEEFEGSYVSKRGWKSPFD